MRNHILISALLLSISVRSFSAGDTYSFVTFSDQSVFRSDVTCVHNDKQGFCWAGMSDGLARFDNGRWVRYSTAHGSKGTLPDPRISAIDSDSAGNTWIASGGGLVRYRPESDDFEPAGINATSILAVGDLCYFGATDTLYCYDRTVPIFKATSIKGLPSKFTISSMSALPDGRILLSSTGGAPMVYDPSESRVMRLPVSMPSTLLAWADSRGRIWRSVMGGGVECYDPSFKLLYASGPSAPGLPTTAVLCFCERDGRIWMGTDGGGIIIFDPETRKSKVLSHIVGDPESFPARTIASICLVKGSGEVLAGRPGGGVVAVRHNWISCHDAAPDGIQSIFQNSDEDNIWVGTKGSGLFRYNLTDRRFIHTGGTEGLDVISMAGLGPDRILMFCGRKGFMACNIRQGSIAPFMFGNAELDSVRPADVFNLSGTQDGIILLTSEDAMFEYDIRSRALKEIAIPSEYTGSGPIRAVAGPETGRYFFNGRFLFNYDSDSGSLRILMDTGSPTGICSAALDRNDRIWLASEKGLGCFNVWSGAYECTENSFSRDARTILCDVMGRVWIGGRFGLIVFNPSDGSFHVLDQTDGMTEYDLNPPPRLLSTSGDLFFGGTSALVRVNRDIPLISCHEPVIALGGFNVNGEKDGTSTVKVKAYADDGFPFSGKRFKFRTEGPGTSGGVIETDYGECLFSIPSSGQFRIMASCSTRSAGWTDWKELVSFDIPSKSAGNIWWPAIILLLMAAAGVHAMKLIKERRRNRQPSAQESRTVPATVVTAGAPDHISVLREPARVSMVETSGDAGYEPADIIPATELSHASILLVEDDEDLQDFLKHELEGSVKCLYQAYNGLEAIEILNSNSIDLIVSDVMMPEMDGFALCRYIKTTVNVSHIPVILLTARVDEKSRIIGYKNGADDYITKPFDLNVLIESINRLFLSRQGARTMFAQGETLPKVEDVTFSAADETFMKKFNELITSNIGNPELDVSFVVEAMGVSRTVLFNKVKQLTSLNIQNYINKMRMEHVINLMKTTDLSLGEIAERSGFSSPRYFSTSFKNFTGKTPSTFKKEFGITDDDTASAD